MHPGLPPPLLLLLLPLPLLLPPLLLELDELDAAKATEVTQKLNGVVIASDVTWNSMCEALAGAPVRYVPVLSQHLVLNAPQLTFPDAAEIGEQ